MLISWIEDAISAISLQLHAGSGHFVYFPQGGLEPLRRAVPPRLVSGSCLFERFTLVSHARIFSIDFTFLAEGLLLTYVMEKQCTLYIEWPRFSPRAGLPRCFDLTELNDVPR